MFLRNAIMAIILAIFFLSFLKSLANIAKQLNPEKQGILVTAEIVKVIFFGSVLDVLLTLLGITSFNFTDIFICVCLVIFYRMLG